MVSIEDDDPILKSISDTINDTANTHINSDEARMEQKTSEIRQPNLQFSSKLYGLTEAQQILLEAYQNS